MPQTLDNFKSRLEAYLPTATLKLTPPLNPDGIYHLDASLAGSWVVVEYNPQNNSFGVSRVTLDTTYGEGPDEIFKDPDQALNRTVELLKTL